MYFNCLISSTFLSLSLFSGTFLIHNLAWHPEGDAILLIGKEQMCICFLTPTSDTTVANNTSTINNTVTNTSDDIVDDKSKQTTVFESEVIPSVMREPTRGDNNGIKSCEEIEGKSWGEAIRNI